MTKTIRKKDSSVVSDPAGAVVLFMQKPEHPLKRESEEVRMIVPGAHIELNEPIKWNAPGFCCRAVDRIIFNPGSKKEFFRLIFHGGAIGKSQSANRQIVEDRSGLLVGPPMSGRLQIGRMCGKNGSPYGTDEVMDIRNAIAWQVF